MPTKKIEIADELLGQLENLTEATTTLGKAVQDLATKPLPTRPKGQVLEISNELKRKLGIKAQFLGLKGADELAQLALMAFLDMAEEEGWITFPLMLQQVPTA
jgi:hypothetical protein